MTAILRNHSRGMLRGSVLLGGILAGFMVFMLAVFPGIKEEAEAMEAALPAFMAGLLGFEELHTIEGFTAGYTIPFLWVLLVGLYVAYSTAGTVAGDIRTRRMDLVLSNPVSRESVVVQTFAALWVPLVVLGTLTFVVLATGAAAIGEPFDLVDLAAMLVLSIPYLLVCGAIGMVLSVVLDRPTRAQAGAVGVVFVLWLLEGVAESEPDYEVLGVISPSRYYDPNAILLHGEYGIGDAVVLLVGATVILAVAVVLFVRRDI